MNKSLGKAFQVVELVAEGRSTLTEIAQASDMPKSTTHRLLVDLARQGILALEGRSYRLGVRLIELGEKAKRHLPVDRAAREPMQALARSTKETVHLGILDSKDIVYLNKVEGERGLQMASYVGLRTAAQCTAMGKALIAARPEEEWRGFFQDLPARTRFTITSLDGFLDEISRVRAAGFALDREENEMGIRCVAAPVRDASGTVVAAVSISGASVYISEQRQLELVPEVTACAQEISRRVGAS